MAKQYMDGQNSVLSVLGPRAHSARSLRLVKELHLYLSFERVFRVMC